MTFRDGRQWLSPLTMVLFAAIGATGVLLCLDLHLPGVTLLHEVAGVLFTGVASAHLALNWRPFCACFQRRTAWVTVVAAAALCAALVLMDLTPEDQPEGEHRSGGERRWTRSGSR